MFIEWLVVTEILSLIFLHRLSKLRVVIIYSLFWVVILIFIIIMFLDPKLLFDVLESFNHTMTICQPIPIIKDKSGVLYAGTIDAWLTNILPYLYSCKIINFNLSDYYGHFFNLRRCPVKAKPNDSVNTSLIRDRKHSNINEFKFLMNKIDWSKFYSFSETNEVYMEFIENVRRCLDVSCPLITLKNKNESKNKNLWYTNELFPKRFQSHITEISEILHVIFLKQKAFRNVTYNISESSVMRI